MPQSSERRLRRKSERKSLCLLVGSPMCRAFGRSQKLNYSNMDPLEAEHKVRYALLSVRNCNDTG